MYYVYYADTGLINSGTDKRDFLDIFVFGNLLFNYLNRKTILNSGLISSYRHKTCI